jgi:hypothetical protein
MSSSPTLKAKPKYGSGPVRASGETGPADAGLTGGARAAALRIALSDGGWTDRNHGRTARTRARPCQPGVQSLSQSNSIQVTLPLSWLLPATFGCCAPGSAPWRLCHVGVRGRRTVAEMGHSASVSFEVLFEDVTLCTLRSLRKPDPPPPRAQNRDR